MRLICFISLVVNRVLVYAQDHQWELKKDEDNIKVYTKYVEGSSFKAFRGITEVKADLTALVSLLKDVDNFKLLFPDTEEAELIETKDNYQKHYVHTDVPWPVTDRDGVYTYHFSQDANTKEVNVKISCQPFDRETENVHVEVGNGYWTFSPQADKSVKVVFEMLAEPNGNIPAWLANMTAQDFPFNTLTNLKERVQLSQYQNSDYLFMKE